MAKPLILKILDRLKTAENQIQGKQDTIVETDWQEMTLGNDWENYGGSFSIASYKKRGNTVMFKGLIKGGTIKTTIFTMPTGFRPSAAKILPATSNSGNTVELRVDKSGAVSVNNGTISSWVSLDNVNYETN